MGRRRATRTNRSIDHHHHLSACPESPPFSFLMTETTIASLSNRPAFYQCAPRRLPYLDVRIEKEKHPISHQNLTVVSLTVIVVNHNFWFMYCKYCSIKSVIFFTSQLD